MVDVLTLSLTLALAGAPGDLAPVPVVEEPAPVRCADATLSKLISPAVLTLGEIGAQTVTCSDDCDELPDIQCSGNACSAVSRNCPYQQGYVVCDGAYTYCSVPCPPECTDGQTRLVPTGECCDCSKMYKWVEECINGQWVTQNQICGFSAQCPRCP